MLARSILFFSVIASFAFGLIADPRLANAQCVDEALKEQLVGKRDYRGVVPRVFKKALRHELSGMGGWYAGDYSDGAPAYGGAYTFHFTEDLGLEASYLRSERRFRLVEAFEAANPPLGTIVSQETIEMYMGHLVWSMAYGKVRWFGGPIGRFDFYLSVGAGAADESGSLGLAGSGGFGMKFHLAQWMALRLDVRDQVRAIRAPLGEEFVVNDVMALGGLSVFIPFTN